MTHPTLEERMKEQKVYQLAFEEGKKVGYSEGFIAGEKSNNINFWKDEYLRIKKLLWAVVFSLGEVKITKASLLIQDDATVLRHESPEQGLIILKAIK